jgi:hypothetical protein
VKHLPILIVLGILIIVIDVVLVMSVRHKPVVIQDRPAIPKPSVPKPEVQEVAPARIEPKWIEHKPVRNVGDSSMGKVLADIESHMPAGHIYRDNDQVTWAHETTNGINSNVRNQNSGGKKVNGFYCLENRAVVLEEPPTTIRAVAQLVPPSLRGGTYNLYLVSQAGSWNNEPLYLFDEWVAYTNGSEAGLDLDKKGLWRGCQRSDTIAYALEFNVYSTCVAMALKGQTDPEIKTFLKWNIERVMGLYQTAKSQPKFTGSEQDGYLAKMRTSSDAEEFRTFARSYFGNDWCKTNLGF